MTRVCGVVVALALAACQSAASPGASCARSSECGAPLVCRLGRCRTECASDRDCGAGARCYFAREVGVCELPAVDVCDVSGACEAPLVCRQGHCAQACASQADCGGGVCSAGVCRVAGDAGTPSIGDGGVHARATCQSDADCASGEQCSAISDSALTGHLGAFYCRPSCATDAECRAQVGSDSLCVAIRHQGGDTSNVCSLPCTPLEPECAAGDTCRPLNLLDAERGAYAVAIDCDVTGPLALGDACGGDEFRCPADSGCDGTFGCVSYCRNPVVGPSECPRAGTTCQTFGLGALIVGGVEFGTCR